jgi:DNA-binding response OmpR family regulator
MKTGNILVIDDDAEIREIVQVLLSSEGYSVTCAASGKEALSALDDKKDYFDLIILDVMMPELDGYDVCRKIREISKVPVLFLTAKNRETDLVEGYLSGGDDYLQKPFSYTELIARAGGLIRRYKQYGVREAGSEGKQITIGDLVIDKEQASVYKAGMEIALTNTEYGILLLLAENRGKIFPLQEIYEKVWKNIFLPSANNTVMVHIRNLREKLNGDKRNDGLIKNKWGRGYYIE